MGEKRLAHHRSGRVGRRWKSMCREHAYAERPTHSHQAFGMVDVDSFFLFSPILPCEDGKKRTKRSGFGRLCVSCFFLGSFYNTLCSCRFFPHPKDSFLPRHERDGRRRKKEVLIQFRFCTSRRAHNIIFIYGILLFTPNMNPSQCSFAHKQPFLVLLVVSFVSFSGKLHETTRDGTSDGL